MPAFAESRFLSRSAPRSPRAQPRPRSPGPAPQLTAGYAPSSNLNTGEGSLGLPPRPPAPAPCQRTPGGFQKPCGAPTASTTGRSSAHSAWGPTGGRSCTGRHVARSLGPREHSPEAFSFKCKFEFQRSSKHVLKAPSSKNVLPVWRKAQRKVHEVHVLLNGANQAAPPSPITRPSSPESSRPRQKKKKKGNHQVGFKHEVSEAVPKPQRRCRVQPSPTFFFLKVVFFFTFYFLAALQGMRDLSSSTRNGTLAPCSGSTQS